MSKGLKISLPASCRQSWSEMQAVSDGRYCTACQKKVIDFTAMTDAELIHFFQQTIGPICGRFAPEQLNRNLTLPRKPLPFLKHLLLVSLPAFLLSLKPEAQVQPASTEVVPLKLGRLKDKNEKKITVRGEVLNGVAVAQPAVEIVVERTGQTIFTNSAGKFVLQGVFASDTILFKYHNHFEVRKQAEAILQNALVQMHAMEAMLGGPVVEWKGTMNKRKRKKLL